MNKQEIRKLLGFYENELTNNILPFWINRSHDCINGGFFNCFDNTGKTLMSHDKYMWSQGRFVWLWSKLASMECGTFTKQQRNRFLEYSRSGCDFLIRHCLMGENDWRCVFLTDEAGNPKYVDGYTRFDMSIYADMFVIAAFGKFAEVTGDREIYLFGKKLYESVVNRVRQNDYQTLPYPLSKVYKTHGIPMILSNVTKELYGAAYIFDVEYCRVLKVNLDGFITEILTNFVDKNNVLHEIILSDNHFFDELLGQYVNPGHTLEDAWFMLDAVDILEKYNCIPKISAITKRAFNIGWDTKYGGLLHMCGLNSGAPTGHLGKSSNEPMLKQTVEDWNYKLWWVHSEALYVSLLLYDRTHDVEFLTWHQKVFDYTFSVFPNKDRETREWVQILTREGKPQEKVVALPVKDPYHISRNLILIIELLYKMLDDSKAC